MSVTIDGMEDGSLRRFGAIGDIHCEDRALEAALGSLQAAGVDRILAVGDVVDGYGDVDRCCQLLVEHQVLTVRGNHERWFLAGEMRELPDSTTEVSAESRRFLEALPASLEMETLVGRLLLCHGVGEDDMATLTPDSRGYALQAAIMDIRHREDLSLIVGGHTHQPMVRSLGPFTFVNPGTLHRDHEPGFMLVDLAERRAERWEVGPDGSGARVVEAMELPLACE